MWSAIVADNADSIELALDAAQREIAHMRALLADRDATALRAWFAEARQWFEL
jgi:prephenate dehydrogenase